MPDGATTKMDYSIAEGKLMTRVTDANGKYQDTYTTGDGKTVKTVQYKTYNGPTGSDPLTTLFEYDAINQLVQVTDAAGKPTKSIYDLAGRRTQVEHPASGTTTFVYDAAGNLTEKLTANLRNAGAQAIKYQYDYNRLKEINYPLHPENDVKYVYGTKDEAGATNFYRAGRLKSLEDGSGMQEYKYGKQGEVTELRRTLVIPNQAVATYVTKTTYDSWNRLLSMTYPDNEVVSYSYNTGGLLTNVKSSVNNYNYVENVLYDKFEQRTYLKYGNGKETNYTYKPTNRQLDRLTVGVGTNYIMNNAYGYDAVGNVLTIMNTGGEQTAANTVSGKIGGKINHTYTYDNLYRLETAHGEFSQGTNGGTASYTLNMEYDNMHNITKKKQDISQTGIQFAGTLNAGYELNYTINAGNCQQISNIADESYRYEGAKQTTPPTEASNNKKQEFSYDANGNLIYTASGKLIGDKLQATNTRKMLWDEENRLLGISGNGFVSQYWYDAAGERTVKESFDNEGVYVNGALSGARTGTSKFTAYVSPYMVVSQGGNYTKHIYMGSQRITSKVGNSGIFSASPVNTTELQAKLTLQTTNIKERFDSLGVKYSGVQQSGGLISSSPSGAGGTYFYHPDHLGSSSLITNGSGDLVQHIQYVPFGEVFVEERNASWSTPYKFNGKEQDEETGLCYYGARYYDPRTSVWLSVDPLAEKYPNIGSYVYCANNPVKYIDPDGRVLKLAGNRQERITSLTYLQKLSNDKLGVKQDGTVIIMKKGAMNKDKTLSSGTGLVANIISENNTMTIELGKKGSTNTEENSSQAKATNGEGTDVTVNFDISADPSILTENPSTGNSSPQKRPDEIGLAHELIHGLRGMEGKQRKRKDEMNHYYLDKGGNIKIRRHRREEFETVGVSGSYKYSENKIRHEQELNNRGTY
jgi:RHS repeat-associated protein